MKKKPAGSDLEQQVNELRLRIDSLERTIRMRAQHQAEPVLRDAGERLKKARRVASWSMRALAKAATVSQSTIANWETNEHPIPRWRAEQLNDIFENSGARPPDWSGIDGWDG